MLVGVNLLREGLDLPEVSLVAILDADKEGFLRGETSLIQTIGRAARNIRGKVIMYADKETAAMRNAIGETDRRRAIQVAYNEEHGITPATIQKGISDISDFLMQESKVPDRPRARASATRRACRAEELRRTIVELEEEMLAAADDLRFEYAAKLRDEIKSLRRELAGGRGKRLRRVFCYTLRARRSLLRLAAPLSQTAPRRLALLAALRWRSLLLCARAGRAGLRRPADFTFTPAPRRAAGDVHVDVDPPGRSRSTGRRRWDLRRRSATALGRGPIRDACLRRAGAQAGHADGH